MVAAHTLLVTKKNLSWSDFGIIRAIIKRAATQTVINFPKPFIFAAEELRTKEGASGNGAWRKIALGLLISVPILAVIIPLLSSADMVFNYYVNNLTKIGEFIDFSSATEQAFIILSVFIYVFGYIWSFHTGHPETGKASGPGKFFWDSTILLTVLLVIDAVYLLFTVIQFSYLYGGTGHALPAGFTYADYARRGFFELVAVTIINLSIILGSFKFVPRDDKNISVPLRTALSLLVIFSFNMLFSANFKMLLYEEAYGMTYLRFFVHYFMILLPVLFVIALVNLWFGKLPLVKIYIVVTLLFYTVLNYVNTDQFIARYNGEMYLKTGKLDISYLQSLSYDAIPETIRLAEKNNDFARQINNYLFAVKQDLSRPSAWQSLNYSRYRAHQALVK